MLVQNNRQKQRAKVLTFRSSFALFVFVYYNISNILLKRKNLNSISFRQLTLFFIVVLIPTNGLFGYYYMSYSSVFDIIIWLMISYFVTKK